MKQLLLFLTLTAAVATAAQAQNIKGISDDGTVKYKINQHSNSLEFPYGYSHPVVKASPLRISLIVLQKGERVLSVSAGDTRRWKFNKVYQGSRGNITPIIQIKPLKNDITTNIVIVTNRRTYDITLNAPDSPDNSKNPINFFTRKISFYYPKTQQYSLNTNSQRDSIFYEEPAADSLQYYKKQAGFINISKDHLDYSFEEGKYGFPWKPSAVYDDGHHVYIKIPQKMTSQKLPSVFGVGNAGQLININYSYNPDLRILKTDRVVNKLVLTYEYKHSGFLGIGTKTSKQELFITRN